jgi:beta-mannanase
MGPNNLESYYSGNSYVDWAGIDMYQQYVAINPAPMIQKIYNNYSVSKPIAICEWGELIGLDKTSAIQIEQLL